MCLWKNDEATERFRKRNCGKKEVVVWKVYSVMKSGHVCPPYMRYNMKIEPGLIESNRTSIDKDRNDNVLYDSDRINRGIHVCLTRQTARKLSKEYHEDHVFRCTAKMKDLVAIGGFDRKGSDHAVFMNISVSEEEFDKGKKGRN